ncbi:MAG TPA: hypothetical protein PKI11_15895 [Candidatus Hydrogenedentes bacterium]|nr:hypothetical protein [Candidatus Hydrogenedentota bacterium]
MSRSKRGKKAKHRPGARKPAALKRFSVRVPKEYQDLKVVRSEMLGLRKISEVLLEFAEPHLDLDGDLNSVRGSVAVAALAWNLSFFPHSERAHELEAALESTLGAVPAEMVEMARLTVHDLMLRKDTFYSDDKRFIVGFDVTETRDDFHVNVACIIPSETVSDELL